MNARTWVRKILQRYGYDIVKCKYQLDHHARLMKFLVDQKINVVFDVGANIGQTGETLRQIGYQGLIVSFEPLSLAFAQLQEKARTDRHWNCENLALGSVIGTSTINVSHNLQSSSLLSMMPQHAISSEASAYVAKEAINLSTVDTMLKKYAKQKDRVFLKIDTQGYERSVLEGAKGSFNSISGIEVEFSFVPLYEGAPLFGELHGYLEGQGYALISLEPVFFDERTSRLLQANGLYSRLEQS